MLSSEERAEIALIKRIVGIVESLNKPDLTTLCYLIRNHIKSADDEEVKLMMSNLYAMTQQRGR